MRPFQASLFVRLLLGMIAVSALAICAATVFLYIRFGDADTQYREGTLRIFTQSLVQAIQEANGHRPITLPSDIVDHIQSNGGRFTIVDAAHHVIVGSGGMIEPLAPIDGRSREYFTLKIGGNQQFGLSTRIANVDPPLWAQVVFSDNSVVFDSVLEEFVQDIGWIWIPFVVLLLIVNAIIARIAMRPLFQSAQQAEMIGPSSVSIRLPEVGLPKDVLVLVQAINRALDRLQSGFDAQEHFVADAAHELRTPLAVIRAQLSLAEQGPLVDALSRDVLAMQRLVNQLLDRARLGGMHIEREDRADLSAVSREVAEHLAPLILANGRTIEVIGADEPVYINGVRDYLFRALRNLVENALQHAPRGSPITIFVKARPPAIEVIDRGPGVPVDQRQSVVNRFWQGRRDRSEGAGIGLSIVQQIVTIHQGMLEIGESPVGGAVFSMIFKKWAKATN